MKHALIALVFALIVSLGLALPFGDGDRRASTPAFDPGHGDYPTHSPIAAGGDISLLKLACLTPDLRRPRHRIG